MTLKLNSYKMNRKNKWMKNRLKLKIRIMILAIGKL